MSPVQLRIEGLHGPTLALEWVARVLGVGLARVTVIVGAVPRGIGCYAAPRREYMGGHRYDTATFAAAPGLHTIMAPDGTAVAQYESPIRWAGGGSEYPGSISLYFVDLGADLSPSATAATIVGHLATLAGG